MSSYTGRPTGRWRLVSLLLASALLAACSVLDKPMRAAVYDFGPGARTATQDADRSAAPAIALAEVEAAGALDSTAVLYRLAYGDVQQLLPYAQARWSMPPAQLLHQRLGETLGQQHVMLRQGDSLPASGPRPVALQLELHEFSQVFDAPSHSVGLVRVQATAVQATQSGERIVGQRVFVVQRPAPSADAAGGVRALTAASDAAVQEIAQWLTRLR